MGRRPLDRQEWVVVAYVLLGVVIVVGCLVFL